MTAVVGILNTSAVAIAADSAVTVTGPNGQKIYNTGNKIFQLSKKHPVGIAIYGSGSLMVTPWEVIIKSYRKQLGDTKFSTVKEYRDNFLQFLKDSSYFTTGVGTALFLENTITKVMNEIAAEVEKKITSLFPNVSLGALTAPQKQQIQTDSAGFIQQAIDILSQKPDNLGGFDTLLEDDFALEIDRALSKINNTLSIESIWNRHPLRVHDLVRPDSLDLMIKCLYTYFVKDEFGPSGYTGLVFVGYGDSEIYPQSDCIEVADVLDDRIRWRQHSTVSISEISRAYVIPFAQTDVIQTQLNGIAPKLETELYDIMGKLMEQFTNQIASIVMPTNAALANQLLGFDVEPLINTFSQSLSAVKEQHFLSPTVDAVTLFSKEDLAEMAESLVYLTYLQKRMTLDAETVSKPVDVAVISKNDGFVWIKRKYYFEQALNPHFLRNYFE